MTSNDLKLEILKKAVIENTKGKKHIIDFNLRK